MALFEKSELGGLRFGPVGPRFVHVCVDMQRLFSEETDWHTPWMSRVLPNVVRLVEAAPERTVFTRFIPVQSPEQAGGTWRQYYQRWSSMTREALEPAMIDLVPELQRFTPPGRLLDKMVYSPWIGTTLHADLLAAGVDTLIVSGAETEVCVLATVLGAIDFGFRVIVATDAICSSADSTHDAMLQIYRSRFGMQVEAALVDEIRAAGPGSAV